MSEAKPTALLPEQGGRMTVEKALRMFKGGNAWLKERVNVGTLCQCGSCWLCAFRCLEEAATCTHSPAQAEKDRIGDFALKFIRETYGPCPESETPEEERWHARVGLLIHAISTYEESKQQ